jgi:hypothetical protein
VVYVGVVVGTIIVGVGVTVGVITGIVVGISVNVGVGVAADTKVGSPSFCKTSVRFNQSNSLVGYQAIA